MSLSLTEMGITALPGFPKVPEKAPAETARHLGKGRSFLHLGGSRGISEGSAGCKDHPGEQRAFCTGELLQRDSGEHKEFLLTGGDLNYLRKKMS